MNRDVRNALGIVIGFVALWYMGAMLNFFPFLGDAAGFTGFLVCIVLVICSCWIVDEVRRLGDAAGSRGNGLTIRKMEQSEAAEIADRWKYDGEYAFYDMTADPEDYQEIIAPELRGDRYFSVLDGSDLTGFFCVEQENGDVEIGLGLRPELTGRGKGRAFLTEILRFVRENYEFEKIRMEVASFNQRAIKVYERAGFVKTGSGKVPTNGGIYDFTFMELKR